MARLLPLLLVLFALDCSPPPPIPCTRFQVFADGTVNGGNFGAPPLGGQGGGFAGGVGGGPGATATLFLVDQPVTLKVRAPLTACPEDTLRASVEVTAPDNLPVQAAITDPVQAADQHVEVSVTFTPRVAGMWVVKVPFEPSLGVRTTSVEVIDSFHETGIEVPVTAALCAKDPWPLGADTIACEKNGVVNVVSADGGVTAFSGTELVVADDVLWSINSTTLERRTWANGAATLAGSWNGFTPSSLHGAHTATRAVRLGSNGFVAQQSADGGRIEDLSGGDFSTSVYFSEADGGLHHASTFFCSGCVGNLVGFEPEFLWSSNGIGSLFGYRRPLRDENFPQPSQSFALAPLVESLPAGGFERWPAWVQQGDLTILVLGRGFNVTTTVWPKARVKRVGSNFAVLSTSAGVRLVPLP
ncbi:MAG: hypothetical protein U0228_09685 [Myxococcaceae bacterium]